MPPRRWWWNEDSGWGTPAAPVTNGRLASALGWALLTAPFVLPYVVLLELRELLAPRP